MLKLNVKLTPLPNVDLHVGRGYIIYRSRVIRQHHRAPTYYRPLCDVGLDALDAKSCSVMIVRERAPPQHQERLQGHRCSSGAALNERPPYWVCTSKSVDRRSTQTLGRYLSPWIQESVRRKLTPDMPAPSR